MRKPVAEAIAEVEAGFPEATVTFIEDGEGGAHVVVDPVDIGASFTPSTTWIGFHITFTYPEADVYPHFIDGAIKYVGNGETPSQHADGNLPVGLSRGHSVAGAEGTEPRLAIQVSRRSKNPCTAVYKLRRVLDLLKSR
jgi:hypothetical protein